MLYALQDTNWKRPRYMCRGEDGLPKWDTNKSQIMWRELSFWERAGLIPPPYSIARRILVPRRSHLMIGAVYEVDSSRP